MSGTLIEIYTRLRAHFGPLYGAGAVRDWWPIFGDDPPFEMLLGAVLVQQTRWEAVEAVIVRLRAAGLLAPPALASAEVGALAALLRPVAFYTQKAPGIIAISAHICAGYGGDTGALLARPTAALRAELLALPRIGPETADVVMLYGGAHPVFVVDDYTRRIFGRVSPALAATPAVDWQRARYEVVRRAIEAELTAGDQRRAIGDNAGACGRSAIFNLYADYHALINEACVRYCLTRPRCDGPPARRVYSIQAGRESYLERSEGCPLRPVCACYAATRGGAQRGVAPDKRDNDQGEM